MPGAGAKQPDPVENSETGTLPFVGREDEIARFLEILANPAGQAIVVSGQAGMGKTWLVNRLASIAEAHAELTCRAIRFEVTPDDSVASTLELILSHAKDAAESAAGFLEVTDRGRKQLKAIMGLLPKGDKLTELIGVLGSEAKGHLRNKFLDVLRALSKRIPDNARAIFVIDPEKLMHPESADSWRIIVKGLPEKVLFMFAQRPQDALVSDNGFLALPNVHRVPGAPAGLYTLDEQSVDEMVEFAAPLIEAPIDGVREAVGRYDGHPYAVAAALGLIADGRALDQLPVDPTGEQIAATQWDQVCTKHGEDAIKVFEAMAVLAEPAPLDTVDVVAAVDRVRRTQLLADRFLGSLVREEGDGWRIYHVILADHVRERLENDNGAERYHRRAIDLFRESLRLSREEQTAPDALAARRLAVHVRYVDGAEAFAQTFVRECGQALITLGLLDTFISESLRILDLPELDLAMEAAVRGNLGGIHQRRGELDQAEVMYRKALKFSQKLGWLEGLADLYGNLGLIHDHRGELDEAEAMHRKALAIHEKLGWLEGVARVSGNLGLIHQERGELDEAKAMHTKALEINEKLGRLEGMAREYSNLGVIHRKRGELDEAEAMQSKALQINEKLGRLEGMANQYGNLGLIHQERGELDEAEAMHKKALEIEEKLGRLEGMAHDYSNIGVVYESRGDTYGARENWIKAQDLYTRAQMPHMAEERQGWIDALAESE